MGNSWVKNYLSKFMYFMPERAGEKKKKSELKSLVVVCLTYIHHNKCVKWW